MTMRDEQEKVLADAAGATVQIAKYVHGVGDSESFLKKAMGGMFGMGVIARIVRGYTFISRHYDPGDEIHIAGFSRGAYTARALAGMISSVGLLNRAEYDPTDTDEAYRLGVAAWCKCKNMSLHGAGKLTDLANHMLNFVSGFFARQLDADQLIANVPIKSVAVWDTVGSMGIPAYAADKRFDVFRFVDTKLSNKVQHGFHAMAIDELRADFPVTAWDSRAGVKQVWFVGAHADVGGGYTRAGVAAIGHRARMDDEAARGGRRATRDAAHVRAGAVDRSGNSSALDARRRSRCCHARHGRSRARTRFTIACCGGGRLTRVTGRKRWPQSRRCGPTAARALTLQSTRARSPRACCASLRCESARRGSRRSPPMFATCVPPHGCRSIPGMRSKRTRPAPRGGCTLIVFTSSGRASSSSSVIQTVSVAVARASSSFVPCSMRSAFSKFMSMSKSSRRLVGRDVAAGHRRDDDARHHVQSGVQAHERVAPVPVDLQRQRLSGFEQRTAGSRNVQDAVERVALACVRDHDPLAVLPDQRAGVARLAAAQRIEDRAIELDPALADRNDLGRCALEVGIVPKEHLCRHR